MKKKSISLGFAAEKSLNKLKRKDIITDQEFEVFKNFPVVLLSKFLQKLFERATLDSFVVRSGRIFDSHVTLELSNDENEQYLKRM